MNNKKSQASKVVYVGLSGGVDSAVAAVLLQKQGFDVHGVFMKCWSPESQGLSFSGECQWEKDQEEARKVAEHLGIPFASWNFEKEYKEKVVDYMIEEYRRGRTPNPDVMCNKEIKFGLFLNRALAEGADFIATGHYVRKELKAESWELKAGVDPNKDQSYFLHTITQEQLSRALFPIGDYTKAHIRGMAKELGLPNWDRPDSQGICFVGELDLREFLKTAIPQTPGAIITSKGRNVGTHIGLPFYTIGQRRGIEIGGGIPFYVAKKESEKNTLLVAEGENDPILYSKELALEDIHWISRSAPKMPFRCSARIRYRQPLQPCKVFSEDDSIKVIFDEEQRAVTPGQSVVFSQGEVVLGGGVIGG